MSVELNEYLDNQNVQVFKLIDGTTVIAKVIDKDSSGFLLAKPHELGIEERDNRTDIFMNEWLYGCDANEVLLTVDKILAHSQASRDMKDFYSKSMIRHKISDLIKDYGIPQNNPSSKFDFIQSIIDGLVPKDSIDPNVEEQLNRRWNWPNDL